MSDFSFGILAAGMLALILALIFAWPFQKTAADEIGLSYGGGPFEGAQFQGVVQPGSGIKFNGWFDKFYTYPTTQRDFTISKEETDKDYGAPDEISGSTSDGVTCYLQLSVTFKINTNEIRKFHENIGLKSMPDGWNEEQWGSLLLKSFLPPLEGAAQTECRKYTADEIRKGAEIFGKIEKGIGEGLKQKVNALLGGDDWFCGSDFEVGKESCPDFTIAVKSVGVPGKIRESFEEQVESANRVVTAKNDALAAEERAKGEKLAADARAQALTPENLEYLRIEAQKACATNPNAGACVLVVTPGSGVNVNVGG